MRRLGREVNYQLAGLQEAWTELVGKDNARHTRPVTCADGTVRVEVDDPAWMYALRGGREREIAEAVTRFTKGAVTRVRLVAAGRNPVQRQKRQVRRIGGDTPPGAEPTDE
jgi:predicted nucleic acid-binding Zn ribbon protein